MPASLQIPETFLSGFEHYKLLYDKLLFFFRFGLGGVLTAPVGYLGRMGVGGVKYLHVYNKFVKWQRRKRN